MNNVSLDDLKNLELLLPPLNEQHRIVAKIEALFSELDKGIESFKTAREQLKIYRQALLKHAFSGKLTEQWRAENADAAQGCANAAGGQEPGAAKLETAEALLQRIETEREQRYQQLLKDWEINGRQGSKPKPPKILPPLTAEELAELPGLPEGWAWIRFTELVESSQNGISKRGSDVGTERIVLRLADITNLKINNDEFRKIKLTQKEFDQYKLLEQDLLCIRVNGSLDLVGRLIEVTNNADQTYCDHFIRYKVLNEVCNSAFICNFFNLPSIRRYVELNCVSSAGQNTVNQGMIGSIRVSLCSIEEQNQIMLELDSKISVIEELEKTITSAIEQAEALRQSILKKAFSGQLVPQDPDDEPASVLLERIHAEKAQQAQQNNSSNKLKRKAST